MPKKNMTPEERKAFGEKMKAAREAKKQEAAEQQVAAEQPVPEEKEQEDILSSEDIQALVRRVKELEANFARSATKTDFYQARPEINREGALIGSFEKYIVDPARYPDPCERLSHEPRLKRFAFDINYELKFTVSTVQYQTQDGVNTREPRFTLQLINVHMDDEGNPTNKRHVIRTCILHEDPQAAIEIARQNNIEIGDDQKAFLDEMRYLRMRDWLLEAFYPAKPQTNNNAKEEVIGNQVVRVYEVNSPDPQAIDFTK
jgi:phosphoenolpyruvate synthase/pyruvate phosphate dikinase